MEDQENRGDARAAQTSESPAYYYLSSRVAAQGRASTRLRFMVDIPYDIGATPSLTTFELIESQEVCRGSKYGPCNLRMFKPSEKLHTLIYKSSQKHEEFRNWGASGSVGFWKGLPSYSSVRDLTINVGENDGDICDEEFLLPGLQVLPHLENLELRRTPHRFGVSMTHGWPSQLPTSRVLRVPLRNFIVYLGSTTPANDLKIDVLVDREELHYYLHWNDHTWVRIVLRLMEETAHYPEQRPNDKRSLTWTAIVITQHEHECEKKVLNDVYYCFGHTLVYDDYELQPHYEDLLPELLKGLPGFGPGSDRGDLALVSGEDSEQLISKIDDWQPKGNLGYPLDFYDEYGNLLDP